MIRTNNAEADYLLTLLRCALKKQRAPRRDDIDFDRLLKIAKAQQVYTMILPALEEGGILSDEQRAEWNNYRLTELKKAITVDAERNAICSELDRAKIKYMFLKGLVIREYYPSTSMRQMSDNDILYDESRRSELVSIMKKRGYYIGASGGISDDFYKKPFCTFEFHRTLFNPEEPFCPDFNPWLNAQSAGGDSSRMVMSREDNYIYALGHMYKHYYCIDGCGIRFICDLYVLTHSGDTLDTEYINSKLEEYKIAEFNETALNLCNAVFDDGEMSESAKMLLDFMFEGGVFGHHEVDIDKEIEKYGSREKYVLRRIFPPKEHMKREYRVLERKPYLLFAYYIYRLFEKYIHNRKYMKRDLDALKNYDNHEDN